MRTIASVLNGPMGRRLINIGHMLTGNFLNAAVMLVSVACAARALGPEQWGAMVLVIALANTIERLIRFESWQPLIKFAADEEGSGDPVRMARLYGYGLLLDICTAAASALVLIVIAAFIAPALGMKGLPLSVAAIYSIAMLCRIVGAPSAALRLDGKFKAVAYSQILSNILRGILAAICLWAGSGIIGFTIAWTVAEVANSLLFLWLGHLSLKGQGVPFPFSVSLKGLRQDFPDFLSFAWTTNLSTTLRTLTHQADELLVGALAGQGAAGMYNLAKRVGKFGQQIGVQVQTVLYPELARMWGGTKRNAFRTTIFSTQLLLSGTGICIVILTWFLGEWALRIGPGAQYVPAFPLLMTQVIAVLFIMHSIPAKSALLSMGEPRRVLHIFALSTLLFYLVAVPGLLYFGPIGASVAHIVLAVVTAVLLDLAWIHQSRASGSASLSGSEQVAAE
ncbi:lipopolysaccharide biosynthesis protein [Sphingobium bisphenolivorans]|uniref:lipopolysaccharide biosynthesis protein n=1 Tax=Sphingobium bisphenolivorans TaxID=1335760 RepID=UPI00039E9367|nr:oligosaccharide flippase family protein [Sphingobium bisphenolivorans]